MKQIFIVFAFVFSVLAQAAESMPKFCRTLSDYEQTVMLSREKPVLYLIQNISEENLWITHPVQNPGASAGWSSQIQPGKWSAIQLAQAQESFELSCIESKPGHEQQIPCRSVIAVCAYQKVAPPQTLETSYWAAENMNFDGLISHLIERGFKLPEQVEK